jgi:putative ABC transport system substrate-binding protein
MRFSKSFLICLIFSFILLFVDIGDSSHKKTIGIILPADIPYYEEIHGYVLKKLEEDIASGTIDFIIQKPYPDPIAFSNAARKLIALNVDIILTYGTEATLAVIREKPSQPVLYVAGYSPVLERYRSENITGVEFKTPISSITRYLNTLKEIKTLGVVYNPVEADSVYQLNETMKCCPYFKIRVIKIPVKRTSDLKNLLNETNVDALMFTTSNIANIALSDTQLNIKLPVATLLPRKEAKPIISLYPSPRKQAEKAASIIQKVLKGKKVSEIPRDLSADMELIFNLAEAYKMNLRISVDLLTEATEVIYK